MIDPDGLRLNVGIILTDGAGRLLWAKRAGQDAWQFPQGGIRRGEAPRDTLWRELEEELGLQPQHVELLAESQQWLTYLLPRRLVRRGNRPLCVGQRQKWFLLRLTADEGLVRFDATAERPEFDGWRWVDYWRPAAEVVFFKREVYRSALDEFASLLGVVVAEARQAAAGGGAGGAPRGPAPDSGADLDVDLDADLGACAGWLARHR